MLKIQEWNPAKTSDIAEKIHILGIAETQLNKRLEKVKKDIDKKKEKLRALDTFRDTKAKIRNARINLDAACEERDAIERRIEITKEWKEELRSD